MAEDLIDDDIDMDEWMKFSDEQMEAILAREVAQYNRLYDAMTLKQQITYETRSALRRIMENRIRLSNPTLCTIEYVTQMWRDGLRRNQRKLLKIRIWRQTGVYPGEG
jgi:hypothetical protein